MNEPDLSNSASPDYPPPLPIVIGAETPSPKGPWGFWPTAGLGAVIAFAYVAVQFLVVVVYMIAAAMAHGGKSAPSADEIGTSGTVMGAALVLSAPVVVALCLLFVRLRHGPTVRDYLGLIWPRARTMVGWIVGLLALVGVSDLLTVALGRPVVPEVMVEFYRNTSFKPLIWMGMILAAPSAEEFFFRGFLFRGWKESRLGGLGTILLTSVLWAVIHLQYDFFGIAMIFCFGLVLGIARLKTGSLQLCVIMHAMMNLIATIEVEMFLMEG